MQRCLHATWEIMLSIFCTVLVSWYRVVQTGKEVIEVKMHRYSIMLFSIIIYGLFSREKLSLIMLGLIKNVCWPSRWDNFQYCSLKIISGSKTWWVCPDCMFEITPIYQIKVMLGRHIVVKNDYNTWYLESTSANIKEQGLGPYISKVLLDHREVRQIWLSSSFCLPVNSLCDGDPSNKETWQDNKFQLA